MINRNPWRELKRVVSQFWETELFYRWIHEKHTWEGGDGKMHSETTYNAFKLADTWNGDHSILNYLDMKLTHMLHNLRLYGNECDSYLDAGAIIAYGTEKDKEKLFNDIIQNFRYRTGKYCDDDWDISQKVFDKKAYKNGARLKVSQLMLG